MGCGAQTPLRGLALVALLAAGLAAGCGGDSGDDAPPGATGSLTIVLEDPGAVPTSATWTLRCSPAGGDLPNPEEACERLSGLEDPWAPVPSDTACAEIYGGPQILSVSGELDGEAVKATYSRANACEIERFDRMATALGIAGV
jgi:ABC-type amino acid transport substrate-binding protein